MPPAVKAWSAKEVPGKRILNVIRNCHSDWFEVMPHCRFLKINLFIFYFWLCWVFIAVHRLSLVAASGGLLFVEVRGLLTAVASLVVEHVL